MKKQLYTFLATIGYLVDVASHKVTDAIKNYGDLFIIIGATIALVALPWVPHNMQIGYLVTLFLVSNISIAPYAFKKSSFIHSLYAS